MVTIMVAVAGSRVSPAAETLRPVLLILGAIVLPVGALMLHQVRRGRWGNVDASNVSERPTLFFVAISALSALLVWLLLREPDSFLIRGILATFLLLLVAAIVTRWVKVSLHLAFAGFAATTLLLLGSLVGYLLVGAIPLLAWSRLALSRHRLVELVLGLVLGVLAGVGLVYR